MIKRRTILKQELVKKLYPDSVSIKLALQLLRRDIELCPELEQSISNAGHTKRHYYNMQHVNVILEHFGISSDEFKQL